MFRAAKDDAARADLEEWLQVDPSELAKRQAQRRRDAILAMGGVIGGAP